MKGLVALVWDFMTSSSLYLHNTLSTKWLIILGGVALAVAVYCIALLCKDQNDENKDRNESLCTVIFLFVYGSVFFIGFNDFKVFADANSTCGYYCIIIMLIAILLLGLTSAINGTMLYSITYIVFLFLSAFLFSKSAIGVAILMGIGVFAVLAYHSEYFSGGDNDFYDNYESE